MEAALYCYVWDLQPDPARFLHWAAQSGIRQLWIAATYHAGWFVHPASPGRKAFFAEDGVAYFHPASHLYASSRLKPRTAAICQERDWLREAQPLARELDIQMVAWTIGTHNTRLGLAHPECRTVNCFGDPYPHALCPAHTEVQAYLVGLTRDLVDEIGVDGVATESFGYGAWRHGHHHERDLTELKPYEAKLMDICFHQATMNRANEAGVDAEGVRRRVRHLLESVFEHAPGRSPGHPASWEEVLGEVPALADYLAVCRQVEVEIFRSLHTVMGGRAQLHPGGYREALEPFAASFSTGVYGQDATTAGATVRAARQNVPARFPLNVGMRLGSGVPENEQAFQNTIAAVQAAGADRVVFYNSSESPPTMLRWVARFFGDNAP